MLAESTTMHWHGQHNRATPYMDGVPYVTQCPILPGAKFRYQFVAENAGTHFWHSHSGDDNIEKKILASFSTSLQEKLFLCQIKKNN